ncbi:MAG: GAP family protein [Thermomicrobiales bacterium]|nr:GAP family protein [Thermomicrobiales bacterium]
MNGVIGDILPLAAGVALSPLPIIAAVLMLFSPRRSISVCYLIGWIAGISVVLALVVALSSRLQDSGGGDESKPIAGTIKIILGVMLLLLSIKQLRSRPQDGEEPPLPGWMSAMDSISASKAMALGFMLSSINPKNLLILVSAGVALGSAHLATPDTVIAIVVFTVLASMVLIVLTLGNLIAPAAFEKPLESLRSWMMQYNSVIMAVLMLIIGFNVIGKGIGSF